MNIRTPSETLANCCWLPRLIDKRRLCTSGELPCVYRMALGSPMGIDGHFLRHFQIPKMALLQNIDQSKGDDRKVVTWFLSQSGVNPTTIASWNLFAPNLGRRGFPGYWIFHVMKWGLYPRAVTHPVHSLFEAILQDEAGGQR